MFDKSLHACGDLNWYTVGSVPVFTDRITTSLKRGRGTLAVYDIALHGDVLCGSSNSSYGIVDEYFSMYTRKVEGKN